MSRALLVRSIPLSSGTRQAWKDAGAIFARRERTTESILDIRYDRPIINLGASWFNPDADRVWNKGHDVAPIRTPKGTRYHMPDVLPSGEWQGPGYYWMKYPGRGGNGKTKHLIEAEWSFNELKATALWNNGDMQRHVDGTEYRVITVGDKVVQGMQRSGANGQRVYEWVGVGGTPTHLKELCRNAARELDGNNIIGWDGIVSHNGESYILEGNSCPGVNAATAGRILDAVEGVSYA